jgi:hypothetical protein
MIPIRRNAFIVICDILILSRYDNAKQSDQNASIRPSKLLKKLSVCSSPCSQVAKPATAEDGFPNIRIDGKLSITLDYFFATPSHFALVVNRFAVCGQLASGLGYDLRPIKKFRNSLVPARNAAPDLFQRKLQPQKPLSLYVFSRATGTPLGFSC